MNLEFSPILKRDTSFCDFASDWTNQCEAQDESFEEYFGHLLPLVDDYATTPPRTTAWYNLVVDERSKAICLANKASIKGFTEPVLRIRHIKLCPELDLGDSTVDEYVDVMSLLFLKILDLSNSGNMAANHIKLHANSPHDLTFFKHTCSMLVSRDVFKKVDSHGMWLYIERNT